MENHFPIEETTRGHHVDTYRLVLDNPATSLYHNQESSRYHLDMKTSERSYHVQSSRKDSLPSPQLENQLPSFPPHSASETFMAIMDQTRCHHPRLHMRIIRNAITLLSSTHSQQFFFPLDHCIIGTNGYNIIPPNEPVYYDCPSYTGLIKRSNIRFILMSIQQILPFLQCTHLLKQTLEDICEEWSDDSAIGNNNYIAILRELDSAFETF